MMEILAVAAVASAKPTPTPTATAAAAATTAIYGLDNETIRSIVQGVVTLFVAAISSGVAYLIAVQNGRNLEREKREYAAKGFRRKLILLMDRASTSLIWRMESVGAGLNTTPRVAMELRDYILTPELAAAIQDDREMSAIYDVLEAVEFAYNRAVNYSRSLQREYDEAVKSGEIPDPEDTPMWTNRDVARVLEFFIPSARKIEAYWKLKGDAVRQRRITDAIETANSEIRQLTT